MRGWLFGFALACCLLAAGCAPIQTDVANLLDAPRLTDLQGQVLDALRDEVGQTIKLKYPKGGDYRSAFIFYDVNNDGKDEAIVLYAIQDQGKYITRIVVLDSLDGQWKAAGGSGAHLPGLGPDVDFVRFEQMKQGAGKSMIIGWLPEGAEKICAIYRYEDGTFSMEYSEDYSQMGVEDFDSDGCHELLLIVTPGNGGSSTAILAGESEDGIIDTLDEISLGERVRPYLEPVCGTVSNGIQGAALDGFVRSDTMCTTLVQVIGNTLHIPTAENDNLLFFRTYRTQPVRSEDVNGDGIIEIPIQSYPVGQDALEERNRVFYTDYVRLTNTTFETVLRSYVNLEQGYRMVFPPGWAENDPAIAMTRLQENGEVIFYLPKANGDILLELLRIRVGDSQGYPDKLETKSYLKVHQRGSFNYYAWLPDNVPEELRLSEEQLAGYFTLIS